MKLTVTSSPHIRGDFKTSRLMLDVVIALIPALIAGVVMFGFRALALTVVSMAAAVAAEAGKLQLYSDPESTAIRQKLAQVYGIKPHWKQLQSCHPGRTLHPRDRASCRAWCRPRRLP